MLSEQTWLLIFDNAVETARVREYIPASSRGSIIYTTQSTAFLNICKSNIHVKPFNSEEGARLMANYLESVAYEDEQLRIVSELVGGLPLAIAHIAGFVNSSQSSVQDFIDAFTSRGGDSKLWSDPPETSTLHYEKSLAIVFDVALGNLMADARELIDCLAFLSPDSIPEDMVYPEGEEASLADLGGSERYR